MLISKIKEDTSLHPLSQQTKLNLNPNTIPIYNINMAENVNEHIQVSEEQIQEAEQFWTNPQMILRLIDLMFLNEDESKRILS